MPHTQEFDFLGGRADSHEINLADMVGVEVIRKHKRPPLRTASIRDTGVYARRRLDHPNNPVPCLADESRCRNGTCASQNLESLVAKPPMVTG
jgi:hypothetical protein